MSDVTIERETAAIRAPRLPPAPRLPKLLQGAALIASRRKTMQYLTPRYGGAYLLTMPVFGRTVVLSDPALVKQMFTTSPDEAGNIQPNLSRIFGRGSVFALDGDEHRRRRKLLTPPFHGKSIKSYEDIVVQETLAEIDGWRDGEEIETLEPMMRITLNIILRAIFGADGAELERLRELIPPWVTLGSRLAVMPTPKRDYGGWTPWGRLATYRRAYDSVVDTLIERANSDPRLDERTDILSLFLRSCYDDGAQMSRAEIGDELLTLLAAGHETTASTLAWAFERLTRHPAALADLAAEADTDESELRQATIFEVQRARTVIDLTGRRVNVASIPLGEWVIPQGYSVLINMAEIHENPDEFPDPLRFDPRRFIGARPNTYAWLPFGGGTRRCVGAAFATMEMDVVLRTILRHFVVDPTTKPDEKWHARGVAFTPKKGGRITVHRRCV
jgi:cytochrome P450